MVFRSVPVPDLFKLPSDYIFNKKQLQLKLDTFWSVHAIDVHVDVVDLDVQSDKKNASGKRRCSLILLIQRNKMTQTTYTALYLILYCIPTIELNIFLKISHRLFLHYLWLVNSYLTVASWAQHWNLTWQKLSFVVACQILLETNTELCVCILIP